MPSTWCRSKGAVDKPVREHAQDIYVVSSGRHLFTATCGIRSYRTIRTTRPRCASGLGSRGAHHRRRPCSTAAIRSRAPWRSESCCDPPMTWPSGAGPSPLNVRNLILRGRRSASIVLVVIGAGMGRWSGVCAAGIGRVGRAWSTAAARSWKTSTAPRPLDEILE